MRSCALACRTPDRLPKRSISSRRRFSPIPGRSSSALCSVRLLRLGQHATVAAVDRLGHGAEVVRTFDRADVEDTVVLLLELAAVETDHAGDGVASLDVGDVERLDVLDVPVVAEDLPKFLCSDL